MIGLRLLTITTANTTIAFVSFGRSLVPILNLLFLSPRYIIQITATSYDDVKGSVYIMKENISLVRIMMMNTKIVIHINSPLLFIFPYVHMKFSMQLLSFLAFWPDSYLIPNTS